ncbi:hypothetical protein BDN70DRAFT_935753 [Pholiota conissans]|uniref:Uncharacterized protein n=1 Tax=Pholiota conissans TaxID=109636 RepID=A0A9P6CQA7_9AGAR|nr:hypothetical protein BDN70DRAFT_935753 [Pholiota conissans]
MAGLSTASLIQDLVFAIGLSLGSNSETVQFKKSFSTPGLQQVEECQFVFSGSTIPPSATLSLAIFGADSLMVWRCWYLYQDSRRPVNFFIGALLIIMFISSLGFTCFTLAKPNFLISGIPWELILATVLINIVLSVLIVVRLLSHERLMKAVLGPQRGPSPFKRVISICVESCALIIAGGALCIVAVTVPRASMAMPIVFPLMTHICVISPLLLIVRVAEGRAHSTTTLTAPSGVADPNERSGRRRHQPIEFLNLTSTVQEQSIPNLPP